MNKYGRYAFYGTLRPGMENYQVYGKSMQVLGNNLMTGYKLYSLGDYPYAVRVGDTSTIVVDLIQFHDRVVERQVHEMELEAGYFYDEIEIGSENFGIYLFKEPVDGNVAIESGDWVQYITLGK